MRNIKYLFGLLLCLSVSGSLIAQEDFRKTAPKGGPAPKIELGEAKMTTLDNGLKVIVVENSRLPVVSFNLSIDVPNMVEGEKAGAASIAGQLLPTGTTSKTKAEIDEAVDFLGATFNVSGGGIFASSLKKSSKAILDIMSEVLYSPSFPEAEFDKIKQQTLSAIAANNSDPNAISSRVANVVRYGTDHPFGEYITEETITNITLDDCKSYYSTYFKPNISYLVVVGDIKESEAIKLVKEYFGKWEKAEVPMPKYDQPKGPAKTKVQLVNKTGAVQSVINVTYPVDLKPNAEDRMAARVMNTILGSGSRGRLFQNLREDKGYTYGAYSSLGSSREIGSFNASASVRNEVTDSSVTQILMEMDRIRTEKVSEDILAETKAKIAGSFGRSLEQAQTIANFALQKELNGLKDDHYATYLQRLEAVTAEDVMAAAKKYIHPENANIVIVGDQEAVQESLGQFGEVAVLDIYGEPVKAAASAGDASPESVINSYFAAIGGKAAVEGVKNMTLNMEATVQGMAVAFEQIKTSEGKMAMKVVAMGNTMQEIKFDGTKGSMSAMGQSQAIEGEAADGMKVQALVFPELAYTAGGYEMELKGIEAVDGQDAYVLKLGDASGNSIVEYYSVETGLKLRTVATAKAMGQTVTTTSDFADYTEINGILVPYTIKQSGAMPFPIEMKVKSASTNDDLDTTIFEVK